MLRRLFDISFSLFSLGVLGLPMLAIAAATAINSGYPVIFKQPRVGLNGRIFNIYKFRSMTNERNSKGDLLPDEDRLTKWGWFMRRHSLDELPQLLNILKGDMSLVGPRPMERNFVMAPERHTVKPGLTGLAQIGPRRGFVQSFAHDLEYVRTRSVWLDLKIVAKTFAVVARGEDYGPIPRSENLQKGNHPSPPI